MKGKIDRASYLLGEIYANYKEMGMMWKNIPLAKEAFAIIKELPDILENEFETPAEKATLLCRMLGFVNELDMPRFCIEVREYATGLYAQTPHMREEDVEMRGINEEEIQRLRDYIDESFPMEEYCKKYDRMLFFDPVERSERWEEVIYDVERECDERLKEERRSMGFCFGYWTTKWAVLSNYDIDWRTPSVMNPGVMFD